ncbi:MAG: Cysteine desulfurase [Candidatus Giovannonibacteria bacterium GW2011_GWA2_53_7]|uniref:Cysteine desulfurase n=1 Tax=Candidatus Giovannonibacteria bacterium GW2011_GWA2_53_7 TaxID=1618650 RepID=A0A0G1Y0D8_9BACT|nr:MAG: Cysteine desulfurase [Candidatus Giovannonibacteria bacterium GW2011_GWA2_53_7]
MREIYLDHAATTPLDPRVLEVMLPYLGNVYGNPSSFHTKGKEAGDAILEAREVVANILGCRSDEIIFTSGGTESDNLAILGYARANASQGKHLVTTVFEHPAVLETIRHLEKKEGFEATYVPVDADGLVDPEAVLSAVREDTILVSVMMANNEIGTVQPIEEIGSLLRKWKMSRLLRDPATGGRKSTPIFHTDACQAAGALPLQIESLHVDMMTLNGPKIYGPKGVGVLYRKRGIKLQPLQFGGAQESGQRVGTENVAGIVGFARALEIAQEEMKKENERQTQLRDELISRVLKTIPKTRLNGHPTKRLPNNVNISFMDLEGEALLLYLDAEGIYASTGSACTSASLDPSHVILALGVPFEVAHGSMRFSLGRSTTYEDIDRVMDVLPSLVEKLRAISPVRVDEKYWKN